MNEKLFIINKLISAERILVGKVHFHALRGNSNYGAMKSDMISSITPPESGVN